MPENTTQERLVKRYGLARDAQRTKFDSFAEFDEIYHVKGRPQEDGAQLHGPEGFANVETVAPRMVAKTPSPVFRARPESGTEGQDNSENQQALAEHWWDKDKAFFTVMKAVKGGLKHGTKHTRLTWKTDTQTVKGYVFGADGRPALDIQVVKDEAGKPVADPNTGKPKVLPLEDLQAYGVDPAKITSSKPFVQDTEVTVFDDPHLETISNYDFFVDPEATSLEEAQWVIWRYRKSLETLKGYKKFKRLGELGTTVSKADTEPQADASREVSGMGVLEEDSTVDRITCWEMWEVTPKGWQVSTVACGVEIQKPSANPYWHGELPFHKLDDVTVDEEYWGKGEIEPNKFLHWAVDTLMSADMNNRVALSDPKWKVRGTVDEAEIFTSKVVHVDTEMDDFEAVQVPDVTGTSQEGIRSLKESQSNALGIYDYARGGEISSGATATGVTAQIEAANARFDLKIKTMEHWLNAIFRQVVLLYQQHMVDGKDIRVMEDGKPVPKTLSPQDIAGSFDVEIESGSTRPANRQAEEESAMKAYQLTQPEQAMDPQFAMEMTKFVLSKIEGSAKPLAALEGAYQRIRETQTMQQQVSSEQSMGQVGVAQAGGPDQKIAAVDQEIARVTGGGR